ncbi:MAG: hypothetical protein KBF12_10375 [Sebaldella sp.]|nr:hypothetical protein [Sebaldella sp.]
MKKFIKGICLFLVLVVGAYSGVSDRSLKELTSASDWIINNRAELIIKSEDKVILFHNLELNHSEVDKTVIRESFNSFVKSSQMREAYILANTSELSKILRLSDKKIVSAQSNGSLRNLVGSQFSKNFDNIAVKITGIKWKADNIELIVNIEGKNFLFPMVLNIQDMSTEKENIDQVDYFNDVMKDLNSFKEANVNVKLTYKLENDKWILDDKNFLKFMNAMVFIKYYNKTVEDLL